MAKSKPTKKIKKNSRFLKLTRFFNFSTTRGKFLIFMLTFAVIGGGYAAYQAFAATYPPELYRYYSSWPDSRGKPAISPYKMTCVGTFTEGEMLSCMKRKTYTTSGEVYIQPVMWNLANGAITAQANTDWTKVSSTTDFPTILSGGTNQKVSKAKKCTNLDLYFVSNSMYYRPETGGLTQYGLVYVWYGKWYVKRAKFVRVDSYSGKCTELVSNWSLAAVADGLPGYQEIKSYHIPLFVNRDCAYSQILSQRSKLRP